MAPAKPKASASASSSVVLKAKPVSAPSSSSRPRVITIEDDSVEPASASSSLVDPYRFSGPQWRKAFPFPGRPPVTEPFGFRKTDLTPARLHLSVKAYLWSQDQRSLVKVEEDIAKLPGLAVVLDSHQVLDTDGTTKWRAEWIDADGQIPHRHKATLTELSHLCHLSERPVHLVICCHIGPSSRNLENLIHSTGQTGLPAQLVLITTERAGPQGRFVRQSVGIFVCATTVWKSPRSFRRGAGLLHKS